MHTYNGLLAWALLVLAMFSGCTGDEGRGPTGPDAASQSEADSGTNEQAAGQADSTTDGGSHRIGDSASGEISLEREQEFWDDVAVCGEWVEHFDTIQEMADAADAVVVGTFAWAVVGNTVQGDAVEDFYVESNVVVEVQEVLRQSIANEFELSFVLPGAVTPSDVEPAIAALRERLPRSPVLLLLRKREDLGTDNLFRLVNDRGLWTETTRRAVDAPIVQGGPYCMGHDDGLNAFVGGVETMRELIDALRR